MRLVSSALVLFVAGLAPSQTYVVDAAGGPGVNFTSIAAAVAAVPDGAVLLVRAGTYAAFFIDNKGLTVLADPGVVVQAFTIANTTATQPVVLRNLDVGAIGCISCAGPVLLDQIHPNPLFPVQVMLDLAQCTQVMATSSVFSSGGFQPAVRANSSQFVLVDSTCSAPVEGIHVQASRLQVVSSNVSVPLTLATFGSAIGTDAASDLRLLGNTTVAAPNLPPYYFAISGGATVRRAWTVGLSGPVQVSSMVTVDDESLSGTGGALGGSVSATLHGANGNIALLVLGVSASPVFVPGILDAWWLDPAASASVALAVQSGPLSAMVPIPLAPTLQGQLFGFQGLFLTPTSLSVSNPHRFVVY